MHSKALRNNPNICQAGMHATDTSAQKKEEKYLVNLGVLFLSISIFT